MKTFNIISIFIIFLFINCSKNDRKKELLDNIVITINLDSISSLSSLIESTSLLFLDSKKKNYLFSSSSQVKFYNDNIIILDPFTKSINCFSTSGDFVNKISNIGKGPGEYITPFDFEINNGIYSIYCADLYKIINYDFEGNFLSEFRLNQDFRPISFAIHDYGYFADCFPDDKINHNLVYFDNNSFKINKYFKFEDNASIRIPFIVKSLCKSHDGKLLYSPFASRNIYHLLNRDIIDLVYEIQVMKEGRLVKAQTTFTPDINKNEELIQSNLNYIFNIYENDNYLVFNFIIETKKYLCFYSKQTKNNKIYAIPKKISDFYILDDILYLNENNDIIVADNTQFMYQTHMYFKNTKKALYDSMSLRFPEFVKYYNEHAHFNPIIIKSRIRPF